MAGFIPAIAALGDQPFKPLSFDRPHQIREAGFQFRGLADRVGELGQDAAQQDLTPRFQGLRHNVFAGGDHHIEGVVEKGPAGGAVILERIEGWATGSFSPGVSIGTRSWTAGLYQGV